MNNLPSGHVVIKLDFSNAFNCIRWDLILDSIAANISEIYRLVYCAYLCEPVLSFGGHEVLSSKGAQQGDPYGLWSSVRQFIQFLLKLYSTVKMGFMDDVTLSRDLHTVEKDVLNIIESCSETGLRLNTDKCEIIMKDFTEIDKLATFKDFIGVNKEDMTLLVSPILKGKAQDKAIQDKIDDLTRAVERLTHLQAHDALVILRNSLQAIPKLLYLLRTSEYGENRLLRQSGDTFWTGLINILNIDLNDDQ